MQPLLGKVWGLLLYARLADWAEANGVLSHMQHGFRRGRCTEEAIFALTGTLGHYKHVRKKAAYAGFVDLRRAYDMVDRAALLRTLRALGVGDDFAEVVAQGFVGTTSAHEVLDVPGATSTYVEGSDNAGDLVGNYIDDAGVAHGFIASSVPEPSGALLLACGGVLLVVRLRRR